MAILRSTTIIGSLTLSGPISANEQAKATNTNFGLVKLGYTANGQNVPLKLSDDGLAYVTVPTTDLSGYLPLTGGTISGNLTVNGTSTFNVSAGKEVILNQTGAIGWDALKIESTTDDEVGISFYNKAANKRFAFGIPTNSQLPGYKLAVYDGNNSYGYGNIWLALATENWVKNNYLPLSGGTITGALTVNGNVTARGFKQSDTSKKYVDLISGDGVNFGVSGVSGNIYDLSTFDRCYKTTELGNTTFKVTRGSSVSLATTGYWSAMVNSSNGAGTTPSNGWWHVISMDWSGNDINNRVSQLAIPTQDNNHLYYRKNNGGQSIANATWTKVADASDISNATITIAQSGRSNQTFKLNQSGNTTISLNDTHDRNSITGKPSSFNPSAHSHNYIASLGNITAESGTADISVSGLSMANVYNNGYPCTYGNVIRLRGSGMGEFVVGWSGSSGANEKCYYRSQRDTSDANWSSWDTVASERWVNTLFEGGDSSTASTSVRCYVKKDDSGHAYVDVPVSVSGSSTAITVAIGSRSITISQSSDSAALSVDGDLTI